MSRKIARLYVLEKQIDTDRVGKNLAFTKLQYFSLRKGKITLNRMVIGQRDSTFE